MIIDNVENKLYFNTMRNNTLALLGAFDNVQQFVQKEIDGIVKTQTEKVPLKFAQKEKFAELEDIKTEDLKSGNYNFLPRMALSFDNMAKNVDRNRNKFQKYSRKYTNEEGTIALDYAYNSVPYDFNYTLNIQTRGLNQAFQLVEQIMPFFRPTYAIEIDEMPIFTTPIVTQIEAADPEFDILERMEKTDFNVVNIAIPVTLRGNLYSPITLSAPLKTLQMFEYVWNKQEADKDKLAWEYELTKNTDGTAWDITKDIHTA